MQNEKSLIDAAVNVLEKEKKPFDLYQLFDIVSAEKGLSDEEKANVITKFYSDLTTSAKFVYAGDNTWDLKANQKIELWEKDGSFYKEYTKVELPDEFKEEPRVIRPANTKPVVEVKPDVVEEVKPEVVEKEVKEAPKPKAKPVVEPVVEVAEEKTPEVAPVGDTAVENYEEEVFEDFNDFDEDKYNEYMDTYEDQYED